MHTPDVQQPEPQALLSGQQPSSVVQVKPSGHRLRVSSHSFASRHWPLMQNRAPAQHSPGQARAIGQHPFPEHAWPSGQQTLPHFREVGQQPVARQVSFPAQQTVLPRHARYGRQHRPPRQASSSVQPRPHWPPQPSPPHSLPAHDGAQTHVPWALQVWPVLHVPQTLPHPSEPHWRSVQAGVQTQRPWALQRPLPEQPGRHWPPQPSEPHCLRSQSGRHVGFFGFLSFFFLRAAATEEESETRIPAAAAANARRVSAPANARLRASKRSSSTAPPHVRTGDRPRGMLDVDARRSSQSRRERASPGASFQRWCDGDVSDRERGRRTCAGASEMSTG